MTVLSARRVLTILGLCCLPLTGAVADPLVSSCRSLIDHDEEKFVCQLRSTAGKDLNNISVTQDDGTKLGFTSKPYSWAVHETAIYFLVQTAGVTNQQLERFSAYLSRAAFPVGKQAMGIALAGATFREKAKLGSYRPKLVSAAEDVGSMSPVEGDTVVLRSLSDAIQKLGQRSADRKAVFVLTDTDPPLNRVNEDDIINQARNKNVAIYFVVQGRAGKSPSDIVANIADKTNGAVFDITSLSKSDLLDIASRAPERIENGVVLNIDATELVDDNTLTISATVPGDGTLTTAPMNLERKTKASWLSPSKLFGDNLFATLAALILTCGLALIGLSYWSKPTPATLTGARGPGNDHASDDETRILTQNWAAGQEASAVAWLDLIDSPEPPLALAPGSIRIGRSRDNDVQLTNRSVHRHHAILQVSDDGHVSIQDLGTKNGVFVNGSRCNECALCLDDVIELGEVKLRLTTKAS